MADHADDNFDGDVFIYRGGRAPQHISHARIDKSVDEIEEKAFFLVRIWYRLRLTMASEKLGRMRSAFANLCGA